MFNMIALTILCFMIHCIFLSITVLFSRVNNQFVSGCRQDWILFFQNAIHVHVWALAPLIFRSLSISCALHHLLSNVMAWRAMFLFAMSSPPPFLFVNYIVVYSSWILETRFHLHLIPTIVGSMTDYLCLKMFRFGWSNQRNAFSVACPPSLSPC